MRLNAAKRESAKRAALRRVGLGALVGANLIGAVLLLGGGSALAAGKTGKTPHALYGKVASRSGSTFKLVVKGTTLTVDTTSATKFKEPSVTGPTIANVVAGLTVGVRGTESSGTPLTVTAAAVFISPVNHSSVSTVAGHKSSSALSVSGVASNIGSDGFTLKAGSTVVRVVVGGSTQYFENSVDAPTLANLTSGSTVGVTGVADSRSTSASPLLDTSAVYLGPPPSSPPTTSPTTTTTAHSTGSAPANTAAGELPPGTASNVTAKKFTWTLGSRTATVEIESYTQFFLNGSATTAATLQTAGLFVGTSGVADAASTTGDLIVDANHVYLTTTQQPSTTTTTPHTTTTQPANTNTAAGELSPGGTVSNVTSTSFTYTLGSKTVTVEIESYTQFFLNGNATTASSLMTDGVTVGTSGHADPASTSGNLIVDANHVYLSTTPPPSSTTTTTTTTPHTTTTTLPPNTAAGELSPGGTVSNVTSTSFTYTLGSKTVTVEIESYTQFFLNGSATTASSLSSPGVTVGTSGHADPASTSGNLIVDANHVYLTS